MKRVLLVLMLLLAIGRPVCCTPITTDAKAYLSGGAVMVPMRAIFEWLGADIAYDAGVITATRAETTVVLQAGHKDAAVNGETKSIGATPVERNGTTYIPLRFVSEALGAEVAWDAKSRQVSVTNGDRIGTIQVTKDGNARIAAGEWVGDYSGARFSFYVDKNGTALVPSRLLGGCSFRFHEGTPFDAGLRLRTRIAIRKTRFVDEQGAKQLLSGFGFEIVGLRFLGLDGGTKAKFELRGDFASSTTWKGKGSMVRIPSGEEFQSEPVTASWRGTAK